MNDGKRHSPESIPHRLASEFMREFRSSGSYLRDHIARLAELGLSEEAHTSKLATAAIFTALVEPLADCFDPRAVSVYNHLFAQLIEQCRSSGRGEAIDRRLKAFRLLGEDDLVLRVEQLRQVKPLGILPHIEHAIVLSRVTLGADVAITSIIIERLKQVFPDAGITLVGGRKAAELFGGDGRLSFEEVGYQRAGNILDRLLSWIEVEERVRNLCKDREPGKCLILDPDSRLTQLGLLPLSCREMLAEAGDYLFFPSREYGHTSSQSLSELTSRWLDEVLGERARTLPRVTITRSDYDRASALAARLRRDNQRPIVTINFGVGGNLAKRIDDDFEKSLVSGLIEEGAIIILDKGAGEDEASRAEKIVSHATLAHHQGRPIRVISVDEPSIMSLANSDNLGAEIVIWEGRMGLLAALIGQSDLYVGYDSAGQHIAAALGVACIDVFAGFSSPRMIDRWRPAGLSEARVIVADTLNDNADAALILKTALGHAREILRSSV